MNLKARWRLQQEGTNSKKQEDFWDRYLCSAVWFSLQKEPLLKTQKHLQKESIFLSLVDIFTFFCQGKQIYYQNSLILQVANMFAKCLPYFISAQQGDEGYVGYPFIFVIFIPHLPKMLQVVFMGL